MRHTLTAAFLLALSATPLFADALILKNGKRVEWKSMKDRGDSYDVETTDGLAITVAKRDVERLEIVETKAPLTGASVSFEGKTKTLELLPQIALKRDTVFGAVKYAGSALSVGSEIDQPTLLRVPSKLPDEYDLTILVERKSVIGNFYVGLPSQGKQFLVELDGSNGSMSSIHGGPSQRGAVLEKGAPRTLLIQVRKDSVTVSVDRKEALSFKGSVGSLHVPDAYLLPKGEVSLFVGAQRIVGTVENACFQIHRLTLTTKP